jgi:hypothetical protein
VTSGASSSTGGAVDNLGIACAADAECGATFKCLTSEMNVVAIGNGGPANGYCSRDCKTNDDCPLSGVCLGGSSTKVGVCILSCDIGPQLTSLDEPLDPNKCNGRDDTRCAPLNNTGTITGCRPTCGRDDQCSTGRFCDPRSALCVDKPNTGAATGTHCDPMATTPQCAGVCVSFGGGVTECSSPCGLGGEIPADLTDIADCGGIDKGVCAFSPAGNGAGDFGFCTASCKTQGACQTPAFWCSDVGLPDNGFCFGSTECGPGMPACKAPEACTLTNVGSFCLDPKYPLGSAAPGSSTSSSSSTGSSSTGTGMGGSSSTSSGSATTGSGMGGASTTAATTGSGIADAGTD